MLRTRALGSEKFIFGHFTMALPVLQTMTAAEITQNVILDGTIALNATSMLTVLTIKSADTLRYLWDRHPKSGMHT